MSTTHGVMTREHPRWEEFCERLLGEEGCNASADGAWIWRCGHDADNPKMGCGKPIPHEFSCAILAKMGLSEEEIAASIAYFRARGGYCDCGVLFEVRE